MTSERPDLQLEPPDLPGEWIQNRIDEGWVPDIMISVSEIHCPTCGAKEDEGQTAWHDQGPDGAQPLLGYVDRQGKIVTEFPQPVYVCRNGHHFRLVSIALAAPCNAQGQLEQARPVSPLLLHPDQLASAYARGDGA